MLVRLSRLLHSWATGRRVLIFLGALLLFMGVTVPLMDRLFPIGADLTSLDAPVFYTAEQIFSVVEEWGDAGRTYELWLHVTWDVALPVLSFFVVGLSVSWLLRRGFPEESRLQRLNLLALMPLFDLLENAALITLIAVHPSQPVAIAWLKTIFTTLKFVMGIPLALTIVVGLVMAARNRFQPQ